MRFLFTHTTTAAHGAPAAAAAAPGGTRTMSTERVVAPDKDLETKRH